MIRVAVIGAGARGREHLAALAEVPGATVLGVVDPDPGARARVAGGPATAATIEELAVDGVDYLVVATPPAGRAAVVASALASTAARAALVEKPLGLDRDEAEAIVRSCAEAGALLAVGHHWRSSPAFARVREAVAAGRLGPLRQVHGTCFGNLYDQGSHVVDAIRWLTGAEVERIEATAEDDPAELARRLPADLGWYLDADHPAPAWVEAHLTLTSGIVATFGAGILNPRIDPGIDDWRQARVHLVGTEGEAVAAASGRSVVTTAAGVEVRDPDGPGWLGSTVAMHRQVVDALAGTGTTSVLASGADGVACVEVLVGCLQSAAGHRPVTLPLEAGAPPPIEPTGLHRSGRSRSSSTSRTTAAWRSRPPPAGATSRASPGGSS